MKNRNFTYKQLSVFGKFLALAYTAKPDPNRLADLTIAILSDWDNSFALARENRIHTNLIAIVVESPNLFQLLDKGKKKQFKSIYLTNWRRSELIRRQIVALSTELERASSQPALMIKGGLRLFDGLYTSNPHRYMADIDLYFKDRSTLDTLAQSGYQSDNPNDFDLLNFDQQYLDWHKTQHHHLPPVSSPNHPCYLEMHQYLINLRAVNFCPKNALENAIAIPVLPKRLAPGPVDQLILNLLHSIYGDKFTFRAKYRLRNIFEGYLLYRQLTQTEQSQFHHHFDSIGRSDDVAFWKLLCLRLFSADEFAGPIPLRLRARFFLYARFGQNAKANATLYNFHFLFRLFGKDLWSARKLRILYKKLADKEVRRKFLSRTVGRSQTSKKNL